MTPLFQEKSGVGGDCMRAAVASVLELPLSEVPHFMGGPNGPREWPLALGAWAHGRGLEVLPVAPQGDLAAVLHHMGEHYPDEFFVLCGRVAGKDYGHCVVGKGDAVVHNPQADAKGALEPLPAPLGRFIALLFRPLRAPVLPAPIDFEPLSRHTRVAFACSFGLDSLALWHLLQPAMPKVTLLIADTGDRLPAAEKLVREYEARTLTPFVRINSDSRAWREEHGLPSDVVPIASTPAGLPHLNGEGGSRLIASRFACCWANRSGPLAEHIMAAGYTLLIDGTRREDSGYGSIAAGSLPGPHSHTRMIGDGRIERWSPLLDWSRRDVLDYLESIGVAVPAYYGDDMDGHTPECASCPAAAGLAFLRYLKASHPAIAASVLADQRAIRQELIKPIAALRDSLFLLSEDE